MDTATSSLDLVALRAELGDQAVRFDADAFGECDSTNSRLLARAEAGMPSGAVLIADRQAAGRGRRGRAWISAPGCSLTFSLLWRFGEDTKAPAGLSLVVGLALTEAFDALGASGTQLKWPNDVQYRGRKLAGILVELVPSRLRSAVIGVGVNLRLPAELPGELLHATASLEQMMAIVPSREAVLAAILRSLAVHLDRYAGEGFAGQRDAWLARHAYTGKAVRLLDDLAPPREGICTGVDEDGALLVQIDGRRERVIGGEISLRAA
jgi:BirA family biotin operon repressor/biotin-[acetyl-CoA-carboxylase] ligase